MSIKKDALEFACLAHKGMVRKAEPEKPMVLHAIDVGKKLESYGYDENVVAAGYLHDVIEDTDYTKEDILHRFGADVCSLVVGASEEDKSLAWEERKLGTIKRVRDMDLRHKAVVCCDKISNSEDLLYLFRRTKKNDFSAFNRGRDKKLWYWNGVYDSLIKNEDENLEMFSLFRANVDKIFNNIDILEENEYYGSKSDDVLELYYRKLELQKLRYLLGEIDNHHNDWDFSKKDIMNNIQKFFVENGVELPIFGADDLEKYNEKLKEMRNEYLVKVRKKY